MGRVRLDLRGKRFGRLTVVGNGYPSEDKNILWDCRCDCGTTITVKATYLKSGHTRSCGCLSRDTVRERRTTHGMRRTKEYRVWDAAKQRCLNPNNDDYKRYGGRGIRMCEEWVNDFSAFYAHVGPRPQGMTIDRIDNDGDYEPGNVHWATPTQQANNRRPARSGRWV